MAGPINPAPVTRPSAVPPEGAPRGTTGLPPPRPRRPNDEFLAEQSRAEGAGRAACPAIDVENSPLDLLQHEAQAAALPPVGQAHIVRLYEQLKEEPSFVKLAQAIEQALEAGEQAPPQAFVLARIEEMLEQRPELMHSLVFALPRSSGGEPPPMDVRALETNVVGMALAALLAAHIAGNADKRAALRRTEMFNGILNGLNSYVTSVLMGAQKRMTATLARRRGRDAMHTTIVVDGIASDLNADFAPYNEKRERYEPEFVYDDEHGGSRQMTQQDIQYAVDQAAQWRQTLMNNQSRQVNQFQGIDSNQTSQMNIITSLMKNIKDSVDTVTRNLAN